MSSPSKKSKTTSQPSSSFNRHNRSQYYARILRNLNHVGLTLNDYKNNPGLVLQKCGWFRKYVLQTFEPNKSYTWYNRYVKWSSIMQENGLTVYPEVQT